MIYNKKIYISIKTMRLKIEIKNKLEGKNKF